MGWTIREHNRGKLVTFNPQTGCRIPFMQPLCRTRKDGGVKKIVLVATMLLAGLHPAVAETNVPTTIVNSDPPGAIIIKSLPKANPTSFVFEATIEQVHAALIKGQFDLLPRRGVETKEDIIFEQSRSTLERAGNEYDGFLYCPSGGCGRKSEVYFLSNNQPCNYGADFHIHLTQVDPTKTRVEIFTHRPWAYVGEVVRVDPPAWHRRGIFVKVKPTTIEEHIILRNLGSELGVTNMPPEIVPDGSSNTREFHYTEADAIDFARDKNLSDWAPSN